MDEAPVYTTVMNNSALPALGVSTPAAVLVQTVSIPVTEQQFVTADFSTMEIELNLNMPATSKVTIEALGAHLSFNLT